jgi:mRNA interferase MazF
VRTTRYTPERGDVVWLDFDPQTGHEQAGRRPALTVSAGDYNARVRLGVFCPITQQAKAYAFEVRLPAGAKVKGVVLSDQVRNLDWHERRAKFICKVPEQIVQEVLEKLLALLDPD